MGRITRCLGQSLSEPSIVVQGDGSQIITYAPDSFPDPIQVFVRADGGTPTLFGEGHGGVANVNWLQQGHKYLFEMMVQGVRVLAVEVDWTGPALRQTTTLQTSAAPGGSSSSAGGGAPAGSWFEQSTNIFGAAVPNIALIAGGGLLMLAALRKKG